MHGAECQHACLETGDIGSSFYQELVQSLILLNNQLQVVGGGGIVRKKI